MNCLRSPLSRFKPLVLLLAPLLLAGCENGDSDPMGDMQNYTSTDSVTLDNKPGSVHFTSNSIPVTLSVSPSSATVTSIGDSVVFTASGGTPPYDWNMANPQIGTIYFVVNRNPCVYICKQLTKNSVFVTDHSGAVATAAIELATP